MAIPNFIDKVHIYVRSGNGGAGCVHFRHDKFTVKGGPDGGDGGNGGSIIFKTNRNLSTLHNLRFKRHFCAQNGQGGGESNCHGKNAEDIIIEVPVGTTIKDADTDEFLVDLAEENSEIVLLKGGKGGLGNTHFKTSTRQAPYFAQPGIKGEEKNLILELKLLADVGLVGFPNAGKSTFLSVVSEAKPKIANYPFTTLVPQLGIVNHRDKNFVLADLPGIIEGASEGKGLGLRFFRHIERNKILLLLIDASSENTYSTFLSLREEIKNYSEVVFDKPFFVVITKIDSVDDQKLKDIDEVFQQNNIQPFFISSQQQTGISKLLDKIISVLH
jgi:GTP-binding protein